MEMQLDSAELSDFLKLVSIDFRLKLLTVMDPARTVSLMHFRRFFDKRNIEIKNIAVVSGSINEPELVFCPTDAKISLLSFEDDPYLFDLNKDWSQAPWEVHQEAYDLVLCEQVLEHCLDPARALQNLATLLKPGGVLHVSVPAINNTHGEPYYFYAGFPCATLEAFAEKAGLKVLECESWASDKAARMYATCDWSPISICGPLIFFAQGIWLCRRNIREVFRILSGRLRIFFTLPFQSLFTPSKNRNATATWIFSTKILHEDVRELD